jgi:hypothetical protein
MAGRMGATTIERMGATTTEVKASHLSLISQPDTIAKLILDVTGQT